MSRSEVLTGMAVSVSVNWNVVSLIQIQFLLQENAALFFVVGIIRNINTLCGQSAELIVLEQVVRMVTTVRGKCAKACDCEGNLFFGCGCGLDAKGSR
jgi:hypothetical protein